MEEKDNLPLVSVVVPCYNHEQYVTETIESIVNQTYKNIELIVIDDGSKDNSVEVIQELADKYGFTFIHRPNKGLSATLNEAIKLSKGKYFAACASDDIYMLDKIEKQVEFMESNPQFGMCYGNTIKFGNNEDKEYSKVKNPKSGWVFEDIIMGTTVLPAVTVMLKKEVFENVGGYDETLWIEDWDMWLRIADKYQIGYLDEYLAYYRRHDTNISKQTLKMYEAQKSILGKWKYNKYFKKATTEWKLRSFNRFSCTDKKLAINFLWVAIINIHRKNSIKGIIKLIRRLNK